MICGASLRTCPYAVMVKPGAISVLKNRLHHNPQNACSCSVSVIFGGSSGITGGFFTPFGRSGTVLRRPDACAGRVLVVAAGGLLLPPRAGAGVRKGEEKAPLPVCPRGPQKGTAADRGEPGRNRL